MIEHKPVCGCHTNTGQAISAWRMKHRFTPRRTNTKMLPGISLILLFLFGIPSSASTAQRHFAHEAVEDSHGVIAPWYRGQNGQLDYRARIGATLCWCQNWMNNVIAGTATHGNNLD